MLTRTAQLASPSPSFQISLQIAFCHFCIRLFFSLLNSCFDRLIALSLDSLFDFPPTCPRDCGCDLSSFAIFNKGPLSSIGDGDSGAEYLRAAISFRLSNSNCPLVLIAFNFDANAKSRGTDRQNQNGQLHGDNYP